MKRKLIIGLVALAIVVALLIIVSLVQSYQLFKLEPQPGRPAGELLPGQCYTYYKWCTCLGSLSTLESFPPQYQCKGLEFCRDINVTKCA